MTEEPLKAGLLLEAAETHQRLAEEGLRHLSAHTAGLDGVVREAIRCTLAEELAQVFTESARAAQSLHRLGRAGQLRMALWSTAIVIAAAVVPLVVLRAMVPSPAEVAALEQRRDDLVATSRQLQDAGADLRRCNGRLCVRIDKQAGAWGEQADYFLLKAR
jgi:hypothetical protein